MGIYIKDMDMPKGCNRCILRGVSFGGWVCILTKKLVAEEAYEFNPFKERPDWCPLIELPSHGDLIDRYAAICSAFKGEQNIYCWDEIEEAIDSVPAIIEMEK